MLHGLVWVADCFVAYSLSLHLRRNLRRALPPMPSSNPNPRRAVCLRPLPQQPYEAFRPLRRPLKMSRRGG